MTSLVFDCECLHSPDDVEGGWNNHEALGISWACTLNERGEIHHFDASRLEALVAALQSTDLAISFNGEHFDLPLLSAALHRSITLPRHLDLCALVEVARGGNRLSLDALCQATLQERKSGHGSHAPKLAQEGRWAELAQYCERDVRLTWQLYRFAYRFGYLLDPQGQVIPLDVGGVSAWQTPEPRPETKIEPATPKQLAYLAQLRPGWKATPGLTKRQAHDLIEAWQKERARA